MTQDQWIILALKVVLIAGEAASLLWVAVYTYLARWWRNPIGRTVVDLALLLAGALLPSILAMFFHLSRFWAYAAAWTDIVLFGRIAWVLATRTPMWIRLHLRTDGTRSYTAVRAFCAEVWRRRFRPLWWGAEPAAEQDTPAV